jgi:hypothetical protein
MGRLWALLVALLTAAPAFAQPTGGGCTPITSLPFTIESPGVYCLTRNLVELNGVGNAITVNADDVVLDLAGFAITGPLTNPDNVANGVFAANRQNLTIYGGTIQGFRFGVLIADSTGVSRGHLIAGLHVRMSRACGIAITGTDSAVIDSLVAGTSSSGPFAVGISLTGSRGVLRRNTVRATSAREEGGFAAGIALNQGTDLSVSGNLVRTVRSRGSAYGIKCGVPFSAHNTVIGASTPFSHCEPDGDPGPDPYPYPYPSPDPYPYPYPYPYPFSQSAEGFGLAFAAVFVAGAIAARRGAGRK